MSNGEFRSGHEMKNAAALPPDYDSADTPVLIKIPDLNPSTSTRRAPPKPTPASDRPAPRASQPSSPAKRGKRRIHRSHSPHGPKAATTSQAPPRRSSKAYVAVLLVVLVCLGYVFLRGGDEQVAPSESDGWAASPSEPERALEPTLENSETLWRTSGDVAETSARPPQGAPVALPVERAPTYPSPSAAETAQPMLEPTIVYQAPTALQPPNPTLVGPAQRQTPESNPVAAPTGPSFWPEDDATANQAPLGTPTDSPMKRVNYPGATDGASVTSANRPRTAIISGLQARSNFDRVGTQPN